jgi:hypothetical protein
MAVASEFVIELLDDEYPIELEEFETSLSQKLFQLIHCVKCKSGSLVAKTSRYGKFYGCNNFPRCKHIESGCSSCGMAMTRLDRFKVCINPDCDTGYQPVRSAMPRWSNGKGVVAPFGVVRISGAMKTLHVGIQRTRLFSIKIKWSWRVKRSNRA